jgi:DNA-binding NarL/FixJ family response regulator
VSVRAFHCDDSAAYRRLVRELLAHERGIELVGGAADATEALRGVRSRRPDVVLVDWRFEGAGPAFVDRLREAVPDARIVILSGDPSPAAPGADARLDKGAPLEEIARTIRRVAVADRLNE